MISLSWKLEPPKESEYFSGSLCQSLKKAPPNLSLLLLFLLSPQPHRQLTEVIQHSETCNRPLLLTCLLCLGPNPILTLAFLFLRTGPCSEEAGVQLVSANATLFKSVSVLPTQSPGQGALFLTFIIALFRQKCILCPPCAILWWQIV